MLLLLDYSGIFLRNHLSNLKSHHCSDCGLLNSSHRAVTTAHNSIINMYGLQLTLTTRLPQQCITHDRTLIELPSYKTITDYYQPNSRNVNNNNVAFGVNRPRHLVKIKCDQIRTQSDYSHKAPSIFYTNCRSLSDEKLDDLKIHLTQNPSDVICLTETWFDDIKEKKTLLSGYELFSAKRDQRIDGGVAILVNSEIHVQVLKKHSTSTWSALWLLLKHPQIQTMIIGCIYHPPSDNDQQNLDSMEDMLNNLYISHPNTKVLLAGDFNRMQLNNFGNQFNLKTMVNFPTRGDVTLDQIMTDIDGYGQAIQLPSLVGNENDHCCIHLPGANITKHYRTVYKRHCSTATQNAAITDIIQHDWSGVTSCDSVDEMVEKYHCDITDILDDHCPIKRKRLHVDNSKIITPVIDKIMKARNRAHKNKQATWKLFSKLSKKLVRRSKRSYAAKHLNEGIGTRMWWQEIN